MEETRCFWQSIKDACMCIASECYGTLCTKCERFEEDIDE